MSTPELQAATPNQEAAQTTPDATPEITPIQEPSKPAAELTASEILAKELTPKPEAEAKAPESLLNSNDIDNIKDPFAKKVVQDIHSSMLKGMNNKFQEYSEKLKTLEDKSQAQPAGWDAQRLQDTLKDPAFVALAQAELQRQQGNRAPSNYEGTQDDWSALSDAEKGTIQAMQTQMNQLLQANQVSEIQRADERIRERLPNYNTEVVENFIADYNSGKVSAEDLRESISKSRSYDEDITKAYKLGLQEGNSSLDSKLTTTQTVTSIDANSGREVPVRAEGTTSSQHFKNIAHGIMQKLQTR
jgi:hypothetical protein